MKLIKKAQKLKFKKGFTLIEIIVVIGIIGVVTGIVLVSLDSARSQNRDKKRVADIKSIQLALELFYNKNHYYPDSDKIWNSTNCAAVTKDLHNNSLICDGDLPAEILDPQNIGDYKYVYVSTLPRAGVSMCRSYHLAARLENDLTEYLNQKAGFDSSDNSIAKCGNIAGFNASGDTNKLVYDVIPNY